MLSVNSLTVSLSSPEGNFEIIHDLSFIVKKQDCLGIVGESGSGKSMTALAIARLLPDSAISKGDVLFEGRNLLAMPESMMSALRGKRIGFVFQEPQSCLNPVWNIQTHFVDVLRTHFNISKREAVERSVALLDEVGIQHAWRRLRDFPHHFSGGELQRILIALVLAPDPDFIILDEPTTALDVNTQAEILAMLQQLRKTRNLTLLVISHDLSTIAALADNVLVMHEGSKVEEGSLSQVIKNPQKPYTKMLISSLPRYIEGGQE